MKDSSSRPGVRYLAGLRWNTASDKWPQTFSRLLTEVVNDKGRYRQFHAGLLWATVLNGVAWDRNSKSIINRILKFLFASYVSLGCLDRSVSEQKLICSSSPLQSWQSRAQLLIAGVASSGYGSTMSCSVADYNAAKVSVAGGTLAVPSESAVVYTANQKLHLGSKFIVTLPSGITFATTPSLTSSSSATLLFNERRH